MKKWNALKANCAMERLVYKRVDGKRVDGKRVDGKRVDLTPRKAEIEA